ncbi:MAG: aminopeptidase [Acetobacteraceae bacterium]|nr:aminopeptidase [Acetobacteraceae bacterium]
MRGEPAGAAGEEGAGSGAGGAATSEELERVAWLAVNRCLGVARGEAVLVEGGVHALELLEDLVVALGRVGAQAALLVSSDRLLQRMLLEVDPALLRRPPKFYGRWLKSVQARIGVDLVRNPQSLEAVPEGRLAAMTSAHASVVRPVLLAGRLRWLHLGYPTPELAERYGVDWDRFRSLFWRAVLVDYEGLKAHGERLAPLLRGGDRVEVVTGPGYRLELRLEAAGAHVDDGVVTPQDVARGFCGANLPCGEVFAPVRVDSARGRVRLDLAQSRGRLIRGITLTFSGGRLVEASAEEGEDLLRERIDALGRGGRCLSELGVGINPNVREPLGYMILDEKLYGSAHLALGDNQALGGTHAAPSHWDMLALRPTVASERGVLLERGEFPAALAPGGAGRGEAGAGGGAP